MKRPGFRDRSMDWVYAWSAGWLTVVVGLVRGRGRVAGFGVDRAVEASVVEPVDVRQRGELDVVKTSPGTLAGGSAPTCRAR